VRECCKWSGGDVEPIPAREMASIRPSKAKSDFCLHIDISAGKARH